MFELPEAKRIRRDEIASPPSSVPSSPEHHPEEGHALLGKLLGFDTFTVEPQPAIKTDAEKTENNITDAAAPNDEEEQQEQEFEFRLFSGAPAKRKAPDAVDDSTGDSRDDGTRKLRIRLRSPTPGPVDLSEGKFVTPFRGWTYYVTSPALILSGQHHAETDSTVAAKRNEYEDVAVSGTQLLELAGRGTWPGCHLPWRVIRLKASKVKLPRGTTAGSAEAQKTDTSSAITLIPAESHSSTISTPRKKKPGKKRRIVLRKRVAAAEAAKVTDAEKRSKKNREKKIKRRQKERERKAALAAAAAAANNDNPVAEATRAAGDSESGSE